MDYRRRACQVPEGVQFIHEVVDGLHQVPVQQDQLRPDKCRIDIQPAGEPVGENASEKRFGLADNRQSLFVHAGPEEGPELI